MRTVVILEDEQALRHSFELNLKHHGFQVASFENGEQLLGVLDTLPASVYIIDQRLPGVSGIEVLQEIRKRDIVVPIFIVTAYGSSETAVKALDVGADDYITKPVRMDELVARVKRALKRREEIENHVNSDPAQLELREDARILLKGKRCVSLTRKELEVFEELFQSRGEVVSREALYKKTGLSSRILDVHMFGLRKKLNELDEQVQTVRGVGYRLV